MANLLSTQYSLVFSKPSEDSPYFAVEENENDATITDIEFTEQDIIDAIDELKNNSASGPDGLSSIFLKKCKTSLAKPLFHLWRKCLDNGITPDKLKGSSYYPNPQGRASGTSCQLSSCCLDFPCHQGIRKSCTEIHCTVP